MNKHPIILIEKRNAYNVSKDGLYNNQIPGNSNLTAAHQLSPPETYHLIIILNLWQIKTSNIQSYTGKISHYHLIANIPLLFNIFLQLFLIKNRNFNI